MTIEIPELLSEGWAPKINTTLQTLADRTEPEVLFETARAGVREELSSPLLTLRPLLASSQRGPVKVLCLGSSTTEGVGASNPSSRWVNRLARILQGAHPSRIFGWEPPVITLEAAATLVPTMSGVHVINGGEGGTTSASYVTSTKEGQIATLQPHVVIHMIGSNDHYLNTDPATYSAELSGTLTTIDTSVAHDVVHILVDTFSRPDAATPTYPWSDYIAAMRAIADSRPDSTLFFSGIEEWEAAGVSGPDPLDPFRLTGWRIGAGGNIHPSDSGHALIASLIGRGLRLSPSLSIPQPEVVDRLSNRISLGNAETGQPWVVQSGAFDPTSLGLAATTGGNAVIDTGWSDAEVSAIITHSISATAGLIAKSNDVNTRIAAFLSGANNRVDLYSGATLLSSSATLGLVNARDYHLSHAVVGDQVTVMVNGQVVLTHTLTEVVATAHSAYTHHGVRCSASGGITRWKNFSVRRL